MRFLSKKDIQRQSVTVQAAGLVEVSSSESGLPLVIQPRVQNIDFYDWLGINKDFLFENLLKYGGILLRGFPIATQEDFHQALKVLGIPLLDYLEGATPRTALNNKIYTATEFPSEYGIDLHNELSYVLSWPMKICFFCAQAPAEGGETTIGDMRKVYERIPEEIRTEFERRKWRLVRNYNAKMGLTWQKSFGVETRAEVEQYCKSAQLDFEWLPDNVLRTSCIRDAVQVHPSTGEKIWFNHIAFWHPSLLDMRVKTGLLQNYEVEDLPYNTTFGDGARIDDDTIRVIHEAYLQETIANPWEQGDFLLLDNMLVAHGRNPFVGDRRILVAMGDRFKPKAYE